MADETSEELKGEIARGKCRKEERKISDIRYAWQKDFSLVQKIVFSLVSLIVLAVLGSLINSAIR